MNNIIKHIKAIYGKELKVTIEKVIEFPNVKVVYWMTDPVLYGSSAILIHKNGFLMEANEILFQHKLALNTPIETIVEKFLEEEYAKL